ncbi:NAD(P)-dependent oxidoreductase [Candidatus Omnitrophota bacterium]
MNKASKTSGKWKVLITPKEACELLGSMPAGLSSSIDTKPTYGRLQDRNRLVELLSDKDAVVLDLESITGDVLKHCPKLKVISRFGEGCDAIDLGAVKNSGVKVTRTRAVSSSAVARHAMTLILGMLHRVTENDRDLKSGLWKRSPNISAEGSTLGIFGFGKIGKELARLAEGFGFKILICDKEKMPCKYKTAHNLDELIALSNVVSLHVPLTDETKCVVSKDTIKKFEGKYLVNTARGGLVDESVLLEALVQNKMAGYGTDVFTHEPITGISGELAKQPNVICSPHVAALDKTTTIKMTERAIRNALHCLNNEHEKVDSYVI